MRKWALVLLLILAVGAAGVALASPPNESTEDPTCGHSQSERSGECPGDHGDEGCTGIDIAEGVVPEGSQGDEALDFVGNILEDGTHGDCPSQE